MGLFKNIIEHALVIENQEYYIDFKVKTLSNLLYNPLLLEDGSSIELSDQNVYNDSIHAVFGKIADKIFGEFDEKTHKFTKTESDYKELATHDFDLIDDESYDIYKYKFTNDLGDIKKYDPSGYEKMINNIKFVNDREKNIKHSESTSESVVDVIESLWNTHSKKHILLEAINSVNSEKSKEFKKQVDSALLSNDYKKLLQNILSPYNGIFTSNIIYDDFIKNMNDELKYKIKDINILFDDIFKLGFIPSYADACISTRSQRAKPTIIDKNNINTLIDEIYNKINEYKNQIIEFDESDLSKFMKDKDIFHEFARTSYSRIYKNDEVEGLISSLYGRKFIYNNIYNFLTTPKAPSIDNKNEPEKIYNKDKSIQDDAIKTLVNSTKLYILVSQQENKNDEIVSDNVVMVCVVSATGDWKLASSLIQFKNFGNIDKSIFKSLSSSIIEEINKINKQNPNTNDEWINAVKNEINSNISYIKCLQYPTIMQSTLNRLKNQKESTLYTKLNNLNEIYKDAIINKLTKNILNNTSINISDKVQFTQWLYNWSQQEHSSAVKYIIQYILKKINDGINIDKISELSPNNIYNDTNKELVSDDSNDITWGIVIDKIINNGISVNISPKSASEPEHHGFTRDWDKNSYNSEDSFFV